MRITCRRIVAGLEHKSRGNGQVCMYYQLRIMAVTILVTLSLSDYALADFWARVDRPWRNEELDKAIAFCRMQPRVTPNVTLFVDMLMGRQIDRCMDALGWIRVAR
jgi:hypothetical protein